MDDLDLKIIAQLQLDGRKGNAGIARALGVAEGTVRRRWDRLVRDDAVRVVAVPNLDRLGYTTTALIGLQTDPGKAEGVAAALSQLDAVHYVSVTTGPYDVFVWVALESTEALHDFVNRQIGDMEGVLHSVSFVNLNIKKRAGHAAPSRMVR